MSEFSYDELATKANLPEKLVIDTASETVARFRDEWAIAKKDLPVDANVANVIEAHMGGLALLNDAA